MGRQKKLWGGRFKRKAAEKAEIFTSSLSVDRRLADYDVRGSIAHVRMLEKVKLLNRAEADKLVRGLEAIAAELAEGVFLFEPTDEDIHTAVERRLYEQVGGLAGKLHTGRSRNDQVALDQRLYTRDLVRRLDEHLRGLQRAILKVARRYVSAVMPGFTHLQHSQPVLFSHWLLAYLEMFGRDRARLENILERANVSPLGASAGAGSSLPLDPAYAAGLLGFSAVFANSVDAVSDRDFLVELAAAMALTGVHLSRLCEELVLWSSSEFGFVELDQRYCTGSSALPQKKNPDIPELVRGKTGTTTGALVGLLTTLKGLPLSYNRDLQEDRGLLFAAADAQLSSLEILAEVVATLKLNPARMLRAAGEGYSTAVDLAEFLVLRGLPFREAHAVAGKIVGYCHQRQQGLEELTLKQLKSFSPLFTRRAVELLSPRASVRNKQTPGSTNPRMVRRCLEEWVERLS